MIKKMIDKLGLRRITETIKYQGAPTFERPTSFRRLTRSELIHIEMYKSCPYCRSQMYAGHEAACSINFFCASPDCRARFNLGIVGGILMCGQFTGDVPAEYYS